MIVLMNSSKTLDFESTVGKLKHSVPQFVKDSQQLVDKLRGLSEPEFSELLGISAKLTKLNLARYANWQAAAAPGDARQSLLAFM